MEGTHLREGCQPGLQAETDLTFCNQNGDNWEGLKKCPFQGQIDTVWCIDYTVKQFNACN